MLIAFAALMLVGCDLPRQNTCENVFKGEHKLMCMTTYSMMHETGFECEYAIVRGDSLHYVWLTNDVTDNNLQFIYCMSSIPVNKVRIKIDENVYEPYVKYRWCACNSASDVQAAINDNVVYMVLVCSSADCPPQLLGYENKDMGE